MELMFPATVIILVSMQFKFSFVTSSSFCFPATNRTSVPSSLNSQWCHCGETLPSHCRKDLQKQSHKIFDAIRMNDSRTLPLRNVLDHKFQLFLLFHSNYLYQSGQLCFIISYEPITGAKKRNTRMRTIRSHLASDYVQLF
ncbi:hypothetical protein R5R35_001824 [Gryllus longicercus]|uniref:Accessory gland protein n=1 Tax=Gryllus longicercus TaxID=2509291 RepID=A0AAN9VU71_9ORTH